MSKLDWLRDEIHHFDVAHQQRVRDIADRAHAEGHGVGVKESADAHATMQAERDATAENEAWDTAKAKHAASPSARPAVDDSDISSPRGTSSKPPPYGKNR